ncbi:MAG: MBL fold metallo-hydrolase [Acidimicrobiia bacterium]|nr:MBL fold metallo-hydrolase [Acidimicrobiia bacterium]
MTKIVILDVGHGNCAVMCDDQRCFVIDAGPGTALLEFLLENQLKIVDEILISHADTDHLKGLDGLLDQNDIDIGSVRLNSDAAKKSAQWDAMLHSLDDRRRKNKIQFEVQLVEGLEIPFLGGVVEVLAPSAYLAGKGPGSRDSDGQRITTNTISAVVRASTVDHSVLFTGDIDDVGLDHLVASGQDLRADILVFPHHGGHVSSPASATHNRQFAEALLSAVDPGIVVFSFSRTRFKNPRPEIIEAVTAGNSRKVMCTQMSKRCLEQSPRYDRHLASVFADGRQPGNCCAGSIVVAGADLQPSVVAHTKFVSTRAPNALCI